MCENELKATSIEVKMKKKIAFLSPYMARPGDPSWERVNSFFQFYKDSGVEVEKFEWPKNIKEACAALIKMRRNGFDLLFYSAPPFLCSASMLILFRRTILDLRDGWSANIKNGYGGLTSPRPTLAAVARIAEWFAIKMASLAITCTPALQQYFRTIANKEVLLVLNGYSEVEKRLVDSMEINKQTCRESSDSMIFICAGKFSEYGIVNARRVLLAIRNQNPNKNVVLRLLGCDAKKNVWIQDWVNENVKRPFRVEMLPRVSRKDVLANIMDADVGVCVIRDPDYDFGTKIFDYILCDRPVLNYFESRNAFTDHFREHFVGGKRSSSEKISAEFSRETQIQREAKRLLDVVSASSGSS